MHACMQDGKLILADTNMHAYIQGGKLIWVAPSGGRDRKADGKYVPASFDPKVSSQSEMTR